jgi:hypothetical protein
MHWRRLIAASFEAIGYVCDVLAEEVDPPPVKPPRVRKQKTPKPAWYPGGDDAV